MTHRIRIVRTSNPFAKNRRTLSGLKSLLKLIKAPLENQIKADLLHAKFAKMEQDRRLGELEQSIRSNKLVLLDIQIDAKKLELEALKRKLGNPDEFAERLD
jgi:hypothetical protein